MVFFICDSCGESVKRGMVPKHMAKCRSCHTLSCVDCLATFVGNEYLQHISCMSEAQRYQGALYRPKENKAERLQNEWMVHVRAALAGLRRDDAPAGAVRALATIASNDNVPRKKKKFINFVKNSQPRCEYIEMMWAAIDKIASAAKEVAAAAAAAKLAAAPKVAKRPRAESSESSAWSDSEDEAETAAKKAKTLAAVAEKAVAAAAAAAEEEKKAKKAKKKAKKKMKAAATAAAVATKRDVLKKEKKKKKKKKKKEKA